ncbi:ABC transporter transmembrane domain-containing protein [Algibacter pectinivorans]|uniref:ABC-type bacteriocin/lantibiotic exporter, contains an N-terminal double-glycine peptidase domain n=1 Tax=Algibacter pectinivorans TaxID=870482 RepID=A0A1I1Q0F5_9FLAO|nr:ABC transporter transmembrane domain-containing protein [Algibacter pectinivorans]SFD15437.1 ABC-type bacteriocin/lantibiotic exporter, contains an N-terminal double-glycine peptidase domain [Algibacter pectinivorans]
MVDQQISNNDCGISTVKTVYNILLKNVSREYIKDEMFFNQEGSRMSDLKTFFDNNGCESNLTLLDVNTTKNNTAYFKNLFPFIVPIKQKKELQFIVINGIKRGKLKVYDSNRAKTYYISLQKLKKLAYYSNKNIEQISLNQRLDSVINLELESYKIDKNKALRENDVTTLFNKLMYFGYYQENYPFSSKKLEKRFLEDLIFDQDLLAIPEHFKTLGLEKGEIKVKAPLVLSVKAKDKRPIVTPNYSLREESMYIKLLKGLKSDKNLWYIYVFTAIFTAGVTQLAVFINQILIDKVLPSFQINILILFILGVSVFQVFNIVLLLYKKFISIHLGNILDKYFLGTFDKKLNSFSIRFIQNFRRGDLTERLSDSRKLKDFFLRFFTRILVDIAVSIYALLLLLFIDWKLTGIVLIVMVLFYIWYRIMTPILKTIEMKRFASKANYFSTMIEKIEGIHVIKSLKIENVFSEKVNTNIDELIAIQTKERYYSIFNTAIVSIITFFAGLTILTLLSKDAILHQSITLGQIITFLALSSKIFGSLSRILTENSTLQENLVILKRYFDFNEKVKVQTTEKKITNVEIETVDFNHVGFEYLPDKPILSHVNINIGIGEKIKIEGKNGSGKSTFCKILALLYSPSKGTISINDVDIKLYDKSVIRNNVLLVSNEDALFNESLLYNLTFGKAVDNIKIIEMAKKVDFYEFIISNTEGLAYIISENGKNLSTGQRKKILLLRALLSEARIIMLDEILSGIDAQSKVVIEQTLMDSKKAFLIISHEASSHIKFDKTYVLDNGKLMLQ